MDAQDHHQTTTISAGHEGHGMHLCHRCGWPFPNPHPSAKHRRAHKKVCGTIEGYKIIHSHEDDHHLVVSDGEHTSDEDGHTPDPKLVKKKSEEFGSSGGVGEKSNKSEDEVFADAVTDFSDSGVSPKLEERFLSFKGSDESVESDLSTIQVPKVDDPTVKTEQLAGPKSNDQAEATVYANDQSENVVTPISEHGLAKARQGVDFQGYKLASVTSGLKEDNISEPAVFTEERAEEECDKLASKVIKHDTPTPTEIPPQNLGSSAEVKIAVPDETNEKIDASVELKEGSDSVKQEISSKGNEHSDVVSSVDKECEIAGNSDVSEGEKCSTNDLAPVDDQTTGHPDNDEKPSNKIPEAGNKSDEVAASVAVVGSANIPISCEANDRDANDLDKSSKAELDAGSDQEIICALDESSQTATLKDPVVSPLVPELPNNVHVTDNVTVETNAAAAVVAKDVGVESEITPECSISGESAPQLTGSELLSKKLAVGHSKPVAAEVSTEPKDEGNVVICSENSEGPTSEAVPVDQKCLHETSADIKERHTSEDEKTSGAEATSDVNVATTEKSCLSPSSEMPSPLDSQDSHEASATGDDKSISNGEHVTALNSKSLQDENDDKLTKHDDGISATDLSAGSNSISDSLEGNCGSVSALSPQSNASLAETRSQSVDTLEKAKCTKTEEALLDKSDVYEPPSFMTLVQPDKPTNGASEIETVHNNNQQHPNPDAAQPGWFPSLTNVVNESEGRKKNEEIIAKVTKQHGHSPLKNLLNDAHSPDTKKTPPAENHHKDNHGVDTENSVAPKDQDTGKVMEEWNSPARYPIEIKKEKKKKGRSYWVPFVCCSSVHRDMS